jgi:hypothetical protein
VIKRLLTTPRRGLSSACPPTPRTYGIGQYLCDRLGMSIVPVNLRAEGGLSEWGYRRLAEIRGPVQSWTASQRVGASSTKPSPRRIGWGSRPCGFSSAYAAPKLLFGPAKTAGG